MKSSAEIPNTFSYTHQSEVARKRKEQLLRAGGSRCDVEDIDHGRILSKRQSKPQHIHVAILTMILIP